MARPMDVRLISQAFPTDDVDLARVSGHERIGGLHQLEVDIVAASPGAADPDRLVGGPAALLFVEDDALVRRIDGMVARVGEHLDSETGRSVYRLQLVPRSHLLTLTQTQEVYLDRSVPQIIEQKLQAYDLDHQLLLSRPYAQREFVVQYRESDLAFLSRLCEHEGISFYFLSHDGRDQLVFTDDGRFHRLGDDRATVAYRARGDRTDLYELGRQTELIPRIFAVSDYNYRAPLVDVSAASESAVGISGGQIEFGGHIKTPEQATELAAIRRQEHECRRVVFQGKTDRPDLGAGVIFRLDNHPLFEDLELLVTEAHHQVAQVADGSSAGDRRYVNEFVAVPTSTTFRTRRQTPRPKIHGVVSGIVQAQPGTDGTQPWIDEEGRYTVRILFDTAGHEGKASHQVRQAQQHAGAGYGTHFPLRPGVEVLMAFIDGDVDRPIIVGSAPNTVTPSPVTDKDSLHHRIQTASGVKIEFEDGF